MKRLFPFLIVCVCLLACEPSSDPVEEPASYPEVRLNFQPNILWLVAEDLGPYIPPFGDSTVATPTLSRLAAEGVRFTHFFSPSGVCAPSRAAISTGMYPSHIGAQHMRTSGGATSHPENLVRYEAVPPPEVKMHAEYMRMAGYYCSNNAKEDYQYRKTVTAWDESSRTAHWRNKEAGQPFFSIFNFGITHESQIWARMKDSLWVPKDMQVSVPPYLPDNEVGRQDVRQMYSNIKRMDTQVGEILAQLEEDGLMDSTIIFWYTDHGGPLPRMKRMLYDSGIRVPMIVRFPEKLFAGTVDDRLTNFIDLLPTILSLSGQEPPAYLDGKSFLGEYTAEPRKYLHAAADRFDAVYDMIRAVRDRRYKYLKNFQPEKSYYLPVKYREQMPVMQELLRMREAGELNETQALWFGETKVEEELFDTENDPHELHNLANDPAHQDKLQELRAECERWMAEIEDKGLMEEEDFIQTIWPNFQQPATEAPEFSVEGGKITISSATTGASVGYQLLGASDTLVNRWEVYTGPVSLPEEKQMVAIAHRIGYSPSELKTFQP
ncbi:MAG: sulfatase-like hydrolase/transferase [Bacteroidota bacterium]